MGADEGVRVWSNDKKWKDAGEKSVWILWIKSPVSKTKMSFFLPTLSLPPKITSLDPTAHIPWAALGVGDPVNEGVSFSHEQFSGESTADNRLLNCIIISNLSLDSMHGFPLFKTHCCFFHTDF